MEEYIQLHKSYPFILGWAMIILTIGDKAIGWLKIYPHIRAIASIILFIGGVILILIACINTYVKNKRITIRNINYLLSNSNIVSHISALAGKFLITKAIDDAKVPHNLFDKYARPWICEPHLIGFAKSCYVVIYAGRKSNKEVYDKLLVNANAMLKPIITQNNLPIDVQKNIKIIPDIIKYGESQIRESLRIVKDNFVQEGLLKN
jgi:hypothetical protein